MDPLHLAVALTPLACYFVYLGLMQLQKHPAMASGVTDVVALAAGLSGWVLIGPVELFLPDTAMMRFQGWIWIPLVSLYALIIVLIVLLMRPRIVIYNITSEQLRPLLADTVNELDERARWAGDCLILPQQAVQLHVDAHAATRYAQIVAVGSRQDLDAWRRLARALRPRIRELTVAPNPHGGSLMIVGLVIFLGIGISCLSRPDALLAAWRDLMQ